MLFRSELKEYDENINPNQIEITGYVCKEPIYRTTPFKREIADVLIAVNRSFNKSDYLPCIAWGRNAKYVSTLNVGDKLEMVGRIQSRVYQKRIDENTVEEKVAYEISLNKIIKSDNQNDLNVDGLSDFNYYANI